MDIVKSLNKEESRNFKLFLKRSNINVETAPVNLLFDSYKSGNFKSDNEIYDNLFNDIKKNAFYRLKNRMIEDIYKSLLILNYDKDDQINIHNNIILSEIFLYKSEYQIAFKILKKAEQKALKNEFYSLLEIIYDKMVGLSTHYSEVPILEVIEKKNDILAKKQHSSKLSDLVAQLNWYLRNSNFDSKEINIMEQLDHIKSELANSHLLETSISVQFQVQDNISYILLNKKDYKSLNIYLETQLQSFEAKEVFNKNNYHHKITMLVWLANTSLKLLQFEKAENYAEQLKQSLEAFKRLHYNNYIWAYYQPLFIASYYTGQLSRCLEIVEELKNEKINKGQRVYNIFVNINSAIVYYGLNNIKEANHFINKSLQPELFKTLSPELKLNLRIVDLIFYFENEDYEYLQYSIKQFKRKFNHLLKLDAFTLAKEFVNLLEIYTKSKEIITDEGFIDKVKNFIKKSPPFEPGNNEALDYRIWWLSRLNGRTYFDQLLVYVQELTDKKNL